MTTTTKTEIHETITMALAERAQSLRKMAAGHRWSGPLLADQRAAFRAEAQRCEDLQQVLGHVSPEALTALMATRKGA